MKAHLVVFCLAVALTCAPEQSFAAESCPKNEDPTKCFVDAATTSFGFCREIVRMEFETAKIGGARPTGNCIQDFAKTTELAYQKAIRASKSSAKTSALKDFYATYKASMNGLWPTGDEIAFAYSTRQARATERLEQMAERLKLD